VRPLGLESVALRLGRQGPADRLDVEHSELEVLPRPEGRPFAGWMHYASRHCRSQK
jgi:hypothetical protein